ncbi:MAG: right-handed parallel beta-helix repeat-containing protein [Terriglobales bacterium]
MVGVIALGVVLAPQAQAHEAIVTVNCPSGTDADYPSITAALNALNALDLDGPHTIIVKGTCPGRLFIGDGENLSPRGITIAAAEGETAIVEPPAAGAGAGVVVSIGQAQGILLIGLVIRGGAIGLQVFDLSEVDTVGLTIEDNAVRGVDVYGNSMLFFSGQTVIQNNGTVGVRARGGSRVFFLAGGLGFPGAAEVHGHSLWGLTAEAGAVIEVRGPHQFHDNGTAGNATSGGIKISRTSELLVTSNILGNPGFSNNAGPGILVETGSSASLLGATLSNNAGAGAHVQRLSIAELTSPNTFSDNGGSAISCDNSSWIAGDLTGIKPISCINVVKPPK